MPDEKPLLLVVDDDYTIRRLLTRVAERAGFEVDSAKDGVEALKLLDARQYMIAIIDLMMPRVSGYELVQAIGAMNPHPVVLVATAMTDSDVASLDDTMVRRVIKKPFDIQAVADALVETAREIVERRRTAEAGIVVPDKSPIVSDGARVRGDNVTIVGNDAPVLAQDATVIPQAAADAGSPGVAPSEAAGSTGDAPPAQREPESSK